MTRPSCRSALTNARMRSVLNDTKLLAHFRKCCRGLVNILRRVGGRHLSADAGRALWDCRIERGGPRVAPLLSLRRHVLSELGFAQHDRDDRMLARQKVKA